MSVMINDPSLAKSLLAARQAAGLDRFDEIWEGVYVMAPAPNNEHQALMTQLILALGSTIDLAGLGLTLASANVSDRREGWTENYRVPDVLVYLKDTAAEDCGTHWLGGPDFAIEITSPGDRTLDKLDFYAKVGTRELLVIDREPWQLTLYRSAPDVKLTPTAISSFSQDAMVVSEVIPLRFRIDAPSSTIQLTDAGNNLIHSIPITRRERE
jgi:Uma2 family endonuclease